MSLFFLDHKRIVFITVIFYKDPLYQCQQIFTENFKLFKQYWSETTDEQLIESRYFTNYSVQRNI